MAVEKDLESQYRNKVMFIASLIAFYSIAGGSIPAEISLLGAKLTFKSPRYLEILLIFVMAFFWWRHRQFSADIRRRMKMETYQSVMIPIWMRTYIEKNGTQNGSALHDLTIGYPVGLDVTEDEIYGPCYINAGVRWDGVLKIFLWVIYLPKDDNGIPISSEMYLDRWQDRVLFVMWYWWAYLVHAWEKPEFGDATLPSLAVHGALLSYTFNKLT